MLIGEIPFWQKAQSEWIDDPEGQGEALMAFLRSDPVYFFWPLWPSSLTFPLHYAVSLFCFFRFFGTPVTKAYCRTMLLKLFVSVGICP